MIFVKKTSDLYCDKKKILSSFAFKTENAKWESQIEAWQKPTLEDKTLPEW